MSKKIALFASGSGSNAQNIIEYFKGSTVFCFPIIVSNKADAFVHQRAENLGVPSFTFSKDSFINGDAVLKILTDYEIDYIVLAGFLLRIPDVLVQKYADKIINIHPSLLPKYGGKGMYGDKVHQAVKDAGDSESGITIHYINEHYDEGNIIVQYKCEISKDDTAESIAAKVHELEYVYYPKVIDQIWG